MMLSLTVSIHAPAWGATRTRRLHHRSAPFQSTPPRGGRLLQRKPLKWRGQLLCFRDHAVHGVVLHIRNNSCGFGILLFGCQRACYENCANLPGFPWALEVRARSKCSSFTRRFPIWNRNFSTIPSCHSELVEESTLFSASLISIDFARVDKQTVFQRRVEKLPRIVAAAGAHPINVSSKRSTDALAPMCSTLPRHLLPR